MKNKISKILAALLIINIIIPRFVSATQLTKSNLNPKSTLTLEATQTTVQLSTSYLSVALEKANSITDTDLVNVVPIVRNEFLLARAEAQDILSKIALGETIDQLTIDNSFNRLSNALHMLEFKGDKTQLFDLINTINSLDSTKYTKESWDILQSVINRVDIKDIINDENALQADIDYAYSDIFSAFNNLVEFVNDPVVINSITVDKKSPQPVNSIITITANASGGSKILYQFWIKDSSGWKVVQDYSTKETFEWIPTVVGDYQISVYTKDIQSSNSVDSFKTLSYSIKDISTGTATLDNVKVDVASPQVIGKTITFTAEASGSTNILYQFYINDGSGWKIAQNYSNNNTFIWTPTSVGNYQISTYVKDFNSLNSVDSFKVINYSINEKPSGIAKLDNVKVDVASPQVIGKTITFTAEASGSSNILYQFYINDGSGWKIVQNYSNNNTFIWTPTSVGNYQISIYVKDMNSLNSVDSFKVINYSINEKPSGIAKLNNVYISDPSPQPIGKVISFTADATGSNNILYQFHVNDGTGWKIVQPYSTNKVFNWKPEKPGNYLISVYVKDVNSINSVDNMKVINYSIKDSLISPANLDSITVSTPSPENEIMITANASGSENILYQFWIKDSTGWKVVQDYSDKNTFIWKPQQKGDYIISVYVKDINSLSTVDSYKILNYTVK